MSIAALVLGILGIIGSIIGACNPLSNTITIISLVMGVVAIILAAIGMKQDKGTGKAIAGLVLSIIAVVLSVIMLIACGKTKQVINDKVNDTVDKLSNMTEEEIEANAEQIANDFVADLENALNGDAD